MGDDLPPEFFQPATAPKLQPPGWRLDEIRLWHVTVRERMEGFAHFAPAAYGHWSDVGVLLIVIEQRDIVVAQLSELVGKAPTDSALRVPTDPLIMPLPPPMIDRDAIAFWNGALELALRIVASEYARRGGRDLHAIVDTITQRLKAQRRT